VALVPRETTSEVAPVEPLFDGIEEQLLILVTAEREASDERSTVVLVRRHTFSKIVFTDKSQAHVSASPLPAVGWGIRLDYDVKGTMVSPTKFRAWFYTPALRSAGMQVRQATADDAKTVRGVAKRSMEASYSLSPSAIEGAVNNWYNQEGFTEKLEDDNLLCLVMEREDEVVAFAESAVVGNRGDVLWLHVEPVYRGEGIGNRLYEETVAKLNERGAKSVRGRVLADNTQGNAFYEGQGLTKAGEGRVEIGAEQYIENIYAEPTEGDALLQITGPDGQDLFVDQNDGDRGSKAEFYIVYGSDQRENRWGYFCSNCENLVSSMDAMGRMQCDSCGNRRRPTRWDAAYL
jgi:ribosomal protein S18 acetylase RimI-like enzyme